MLSIAGWLVGQNLLHKYIIELLLLHEGGHLWLGLIEDYL